MDYSPEEIEQLTQTTSELLGEYYLPFAQEGAPQADLDLHVVMSHLADMQAVLHQLHSAREGASPWHPVTEETAAIESLLYFPATYRKDGSAEHSPMYKVGRSRDFPHRTPTLRQAIVPPDPSMHDTRGDRDA